MRKNLINPRALLATKAVGGILFCTLLTSCFGQGPKRHTNPDPAGNGKGDETIAVSEDASKKIGGFGSHTADDLLDALAKMTKDHTPKDFKKNDPDFYQLIKEVDAREALQVLFYPTDTEKSKFKKMFEKFSKHGKTEGSGEAEEHSSIDKPTGYYAEFVDKTLKSSASSKRHTNLYLLTEGLRMVNAIAKKENVNEAINKFEQSIQVAQTGLCAKVRKSDEKPQIEFEKTEAGKYTFKKDYKLDKDTKKAAEDFLTAVKKELGIN